MLAVLVLGGCRAPVLVATLSPAGPQAPLTFLLTGRGAGPLTVRWGEGEAELPAAVSGAPLCGFLPGQDDEVTVTDGRSTLRLPVRPPLLDAEEMPQIEVVTRDDHLEPGYTLVPWWGSPVEEAQRVAALTADGDVAWLYRAEAQVIDAETIPGGLSLLLGEPVSEIREIDWAGRVVRAFHAEGSPGGGLAVSAPARFHHDAVPLEDGGYLVLSKDLREVSDFPLSYDLTTTGPASIEEDVVVRFDAGGAVQWELRLGDVIDPRRIGFDSLLSVGELGGLDWAHANGLWQEMDGRVGVSMRNQDAAILVDPADGSLSWILGTWANWESPWSDALLEPLGPMGWPSHFHAAHRDAEGQITLFDNGSAPSSPGEGVPLPPETSRHSRVVRYAVDEDARTVREVAAYDLRDSVGQVYSEALGDADLLPNGDLLGVYGRIVAEAGAPVTPGAARLVQWDPSGAVVWELHLTTDPRSLPAGWNSYRAERVSSLGGAAR